MGPKFHQSVVNAGLVRIVQPTLAPGRSQTIGSHSLNFYLLPTNSSLGHQIQNIYLHPQSISLTDIIGYNRMVRKSQLWIILNFVNCTCLVAFAHHSVSRTELSKWTRTAFNSIRSQWSAVCCSFTRRGTELSRFTWTAFNFIPFQWSPFASKRDREMMVPHPPKLAGCPRWFHRIKFIYDVALYPPAVQHQKLGLR